MFAVILTVVCKVEIHRPNLLRIAANWHQSFGQFFEFANKSFPPSNDFRSGSGYYGQQTGICDKETMIRPQSIRLREVLFGLCSLSLRHASWRD